MTETTYEQILQRMEQTYGAQAGFVPAEASDLGIRLRVMAGEIYNMQSGIAWLKRQAFPQTASGEYLDLHAEQRGLKRQGETLSSGTLTFRRSAVLNYSLTVPKGTICALSSDPAIRFVTTEQGTLPAGELSVTVPAVSEQGGTASNAAEYTVTQMITPPVGFETVTNGTAFSGGAAAETDEQLRKRLQHRFLNRSNGTNKAFFTEFACSYDGVYSANTAAAGDTSNLVVVYVCGKDGHISAALRSQIQADLDAVKEINVEAVVINAANREIDFAAYVTPAAPYTMEEIRPDCEALIREYISELQVGEKFVAVQAAQKLMNAGLISNYKLYSYTTDVSMEPQERGYCNSILLTELV